MSEPFRPPRWFITTAWRVHRALFRLTGGRVGLRTPRAGVAGMMRLHTTGRTSGQERTAIVSYIQDGPALVTLAMNGWSDPAPQWWRNLRATPEAEVETVAGTRRPVRARAASGAERDRLWETLRHVQGWGDLDQYSALRSGSTPVVVLEAREA